MGILLKIIISRPDSMESGITYPPDVSIHWAPPTTLDLSSTTIPFVQQLMPLYNIWVLCNNRKSKCDDEGNTQYTIF